LPTNVAIVTLTRPSLYQGYVTPRHLHSFPTRRSSDLEAAHRPGHHQKRQAYDQRRDVRVEDRRPCAVIARGDGRLRACAAAQLLDRKSTRLNSSHSQISYAVFCLKKKKQNNHDAICLI